ncbi:hypothetical protein C8T65DRAFT_51095 [Cerioporus squamosus]|nr:hypothetical protein C8T65DRAFT_51095 [Cerioporus squamosus]
MPRTTSRSTKPVSNDLRWAIVHMRHLRDMSTDDISRCTGTNLQTVQRILRLFQKSGHIAPRKSNEARAAILSQNNVKVCTIFSSFRKLDDVGLGSRNLMKILCVSQLCSRHERREPACWHGDWRRECERRVVGCGGNRGLLDRLRPRLRHRTMTRILLLRGRVGRCDRSRTSPQRVLLGGRISRLLDWHGSRRLWMAKLGAP